MIRWFIRLDAKTRSWIGLLVSVALFVGLGSALLPHQPPHYPDYVSDSPAPSGVKGIYTLLQDRTDKVSVWKEVPGGLPHLNGKQMMIVIEPYEPFNPEEEASLIRWMEAGNTVWLVDEYPYQHFDIEVDEVGDSPSEQVASIEGKAEWMGSYRASVRSISRISPAENDRVLLTDEKGVVALSRPYGAGELLVSVTPEWMTNEKILNEDHVDLLLPFIERGSAEVIWFNEYVHGYAKSPTLLETYPHWFLLVAAQMVIVGGFWLWYKGRRFGPVEVPRELTVRYGDERIRAMASWYERSGFWTPSMMIQQQYVRQRMQEVWGIPVSLDAGALMDAVKHRLSSEEWIEWKRLWSDMEQLPQGTKISHKQYMEWAKQLDRVRKEIDKR
jgi:hypothetical protein